MDTRVESASLLRSGVRVTQIQISTTAQSLDTLLAAAVSGRSSMPDRKSIRIRNEDASLSFYILEASDQTVTEGWEIAPSEEFSASATPTFTANNSSDGGFYLAISSGGPITATVLEGK